MRLTNSPVDNDLKKSLVQTYVRLLFLTKVKPTQLTLEGGNTLLKELSHDDLSALVLPSVQKSLLRTPEAVLTSLTHLAKSVTLDLGQYMKDLTKLLQAPLHHKEDSIRADAVTTCTQLAARCSDPTVVKSFITSLYDVYFGSDGKLTVTTHKVSVLEAIEGVCCHGVPQTSSTPLLETFINKWLKVMESESHEGSLLQGMSALQSWFTKSMPVDTAVVKTLVENFQKQLALKTWTAGVRAAYFRALSAVVDSCDVTVLAPLLVKPTIKVLEKAMTQHTQVANSLYLRKIQIFYWFFTNKCRP